MPRGILDALYWQFHTAYLTNCRDRARQALNMLEAEAPSDEALLSGLASEVGPTHVERFKVMRERVRHEVYGRLNGAGYSIPTAWSGPAEPSGHELEFCRRVLSEPTGLLGAIGATRAAVIVPELPMPPYGRCDFLVDERRIWRVVEVKMGEAPTSVVSQIDKYRLAAELDMCMGLHDEVMAVVAAEGFGTYVVGELSRMSVAMLEHHGSPDSFRRVA